MGSFRCTRELEANEAPINQVVLTSVMNCLRFFRIVSLRKNLQSVHQVALFVISKCYLLEDPIVCSCCKIGLAHFFQGKGPLMYSLICDFQLRHTRTPSIDSNKRHLPRHRLFSRDYCHHQLGMQKSSTILHLKCY